MAPVPVMPREQSPPARRSVGHPVAPAAHGETSRASWLPALSRRGQPRLHHVQAYLSQAAQHDRQATVWLDRLPLPCKSCKAHGRSLKVQHDAAWQRSARLRPAELATRWVAPRTFVHRQGQLGAVGAVEAHRCSISPSLALHGGRKGWWQLSSLPAPQAYCPAAGAILTGEAAMPQKCSPHQQRVAAWLVVAEAAIHGALPAAAQGGSCTCMLLR